MPALEKHIKFNDDKLRQRFSGRRMPMATLYEAYFDGAIDIPGDIYEFLRERDDLVEYKLEPRHFHWAATHFLPEALIHSQKQDTRIVREHYDRGNDFFEWFLGDRMVYTSGFFANPEQTVEEAQDNKMKLVCDKLQLKPGERLLDIGCGWGSLARFAAKHYGVDATGVTISEKQTEYGNRRMAEDGLSDRARVLCLDYRDIPKDRPFDKIVSLEMVEHVGVKNLSSFYGLVQELLVDDGLFVLQWTGLRKKNRKEDLIWILFMGKYIFPGADASLSPSAMLSSIESAGWELHSMENLSIHYSWTIKKWHDHWLRNKDAVLAAYGERWFRIWHFFLAWSSIIATQGNAACFQVVLNKNLDRYDRTRWVKNKSPVFGERAQFAVDGQQPTL